MKRLTQWAGLLTGLLLIACSDADRTANQTTIDVAGAMRTFRSSKYLN